MTLTEENETAPPQAAPEKSRGKEEATRSSILCVGDGSEEAPFDTVEPRDGDIEALASSSSSNGGGSHSNILIENKNDTNVDAVINCSSYDANNEVDTDDEVSFHSDDVTVRRGRPSFNSSGTRSRSQQHQQQQQQLQQQQQPSALTPNTWMSRFGIIDPYGEDTSDDPNDNRKSHLCCVVCCDLVKAVIIVDCIDIIVAFIIVVISLTGHRSISASFRPSRKRWTTTKSWRASWRTAGSLPL
jgi:hypothetical protein